MKLHETWLLKAKNDLKSSKKLIDGEDSVLDTSIYHTQQCAEKALKAYLAFKKEPIKKTHDVEYLVELCNEFDSDFGNLIEDAEALNPYSTLFRYPDIVLEPEEEDVRHAIQIAQTFYDFVQKKIVSEEAESQRDKKPEEDE